MDSKDGVLVLLLFLVLLVLAGGGGAVFISQRRAAQAQLERAMVAERDATERALVTKLVLAEPAPTPTEGQLELDPQRRQRALDLILAQRDEHLSSHPDCDHPVLQRAGDLAWLLGDADRAEAAWRLGTEQPLEREACQARLDALAAGRDPLGD